MRPTANYGWPVAEMDDVRRTYPADVDGPRSDAIDAALHNLATQGATSRYERIESTGKALTLSTSLQEVANVTSANAGNSRTTPALIHAIYICTFSASTATNDVTFNLEIRNSGNTSTHDSGGSVIAVMHASVRYQTAIHASYVCPAQTGLYIRVMASVATGSGTVWADAKVHKLLVHKHW